MISVTSGTLVIFLSAQALKTCQISLLNYEFMSVQSSLIIASRYFRIKVA